MKIEKQTLLKKLAFIQGTIFQIFFRKSEYKIKNLGLLGYSKHS